MEKSRPFNAINRDLLQFKSFYFFFMSGFGSLFPYLPVYFRQIGLSASHVGLLIGLRPIVQLASAPFWAIMADKYKKRKAILVMSILAWLVMTLALAFVEPTEGICEVRAENESTSRFVNYTKIKTGFFRRSVAANEKHSEKRQEDVLEQTSADVVAVPMKRIFSQDAYKTELHPASFQIVTETQNMSKRNNSIVLATKTRQIETKATLDLASSSRPNFSNDKNIFRIDQTDSNNDGSGWKNNQRKRRKGGIAGGFAKMNQNSRTNHIIFQNNNTAGDAVSQVFNNSTVRKEKPATRFEKYNGYHPRTQRTLPRPIGKKAIATDFQKKKQKIPGFSASNVSQRDGKGDKKTGANLTEIDNQHNSTNHKRKNLHQGDALRLTSPRKTRQTIRGIVVEFSNGDFVNSHSTKDENISSLNSGDKIVESGSAEIETSGSQEGETLTNSATENVKDAAQRLKIQIAKSVNFLSSMADNSSKSLLHQTIAMFSHKNATIPTNAEDQRNTSQLSNAFRNLIKSSQKYISSDVPAEHSAEGSSALHTKHDFTNLAHLMINQKDELKALDNLHHEKIGNSNKDVIHHSVLPDHVLPYSNTNKTAVIQDDYAQNDVTSGSGMEINSEETFSKMNNFVNGNKLPTEDSQKNVSLKELVKEAKVNVTEEKDQNLMDQGNMKPSLLESPISQVQIKFINVLKSNKQEMSRIFTILLIIVVVGEFLESPSFTLADASLLERLGENRRFYGKQRLWGSIGFGVCSFIVGLLLERSSHVVCNEKYTDYMICFCFFGITMLLTLFVTTSFDFHYSDTQSNSSSVLSALCNLHYGSCLLAACVMGIDFSMCHNFLTWFLEDLGASKSLMGLAIISRAFADTITFYFAGSVIKAVGQIRVMIMVFISYTVILLTLSILHNPWWAIPVEILDGITYAMAWSACTSYLAGAVPAESVTTLQGELVEQNIINKYVSGLIILPKLGDESDGALAKTT